MQSIISAGVLLIKARAGGERDEKVVRGGKKTFSNGGLSRIKKHSLANDADVRRILISKRRANLARGGGEGTSDGTVSFTCYIYDKFSDLAEAPLVILRFFDLGVPSASIVIDDDGTQCWKRIFDLEVFGSLRLVDSFEG